MPSDTTVSEWQKVSGMTIICLLMSSGPPPLDEKRHRMTIICLYAPSDMIVSGWQKVSGMTIIFLRMSSGPPPLDDKRAQNDNKLSLRTIEHDCV